MDVKLVLGMAALLLALPIRGGEINLAISPAYAFSVDTTGEPTVVKSLDPVPLKYHVAQKIVAARAGSPGVAEKLVDSPQAAGVCSWIPSCGGTWVLTNSVEGVAVFHVRHSLFPETWGAGTEADPAEMMDNDEIAGMIESGSAGVGFVFSLGGIGSLGSLMLPEDKALEEIEAGTYRVVAADSGLMFRSSLKPFVLDTVRTGPDRRWLCGKTASIAYTGDNWIGNGDAACVLEMVSPSGTQRRIELAGTGVYEFCPQERGVWELRLTDSYEVLSGRLSVVHDALIMLMR